VTFREPLAPYTLGFSLLPLADAFPSVTGVGAIRLRFGLLPEPSSVSASLSLLRPGAPVTEPRGVSGGVVIGIPVTCPEFAAVILGTWPAIKGGLLITPVGAAEACVMIDDVELDRVGDVGLWTNVAVVSAGGDGAVRELAESRCRW